VNYTELVAAIKGYCENDFPTTAGSFTSTDQVNTFIKQAEQRIYNSVQFPAIRKNVTAATTINNKYLSSPADFLATYSLAVIDDTGSLRVSVK
jgi:LEA14-like dessication related protein